MKTVSNETPLIDASERCRVRVVIAVFLLVISLPYLWAIAIAPPEFEYSGLLYNPVDQSVHLAWARQARNGQFFIRDLFTTESLGIERPLFFNLFTSVIGWISALTKLPLVVVYHALRLVFSALALWWFYNLCAQLTTEKRTRFLALVLAAFSGGAGWLQPLFANRTFIDRANGQLMMPEAFTFFSALIFPLYITSMALLPLIYSSVLSAQRSGSLRPAIVGGFAAMLLSNIHTYDVIPLNIVLLLWAITSTTYFNKENTARRMQWLAPLIVILFTLPPLLYQVFAFRNSEEFRVKALTKTSAPPFLDIILSYSPLILLALLGAVVLWRETQNRRAAFLMLTWLVVTLAVIYAPVSFARKMIEGAHLPLCFLAAAGLSALIARLPNLSTQKLVAGGTVALLSVSSLQFTMWCLENAQDNNRARANVLMPPLYLPPGDAAMLRYLDSSTQPHDRAVLCTTFLGNYIPQETARTVYLGHWAETLYYGDKLVQTFRFYGLVPSQPPMTSEEALQWLHKNRIGIVVIGAYEKQLGARLPLQLDLLHETKGTTAYIVPPRPNEY